MSRIIVTPVIRVNLVEYLLKTKPEEVEAVGRNNLLRAARLFRTPALGELYSQAFTLEMEARDRLTKELEAEGIMAFIPSRNIRLYARPNEIFVGLEGAGPDYPGNPQNQPVAYEATKEVARWLLQEAGSQLLALARAQTQAPATQSSTSSPYAVTSLEDLF